MKKQLHGAKRRTILFAEDEVLVRMSIADYLRECGYRVHEAADSDEALTVLTSDEEVDVVFTAAELPGSLDGFGLSQWARNNRPDIKVVVAGR